MPWYVLAFWVGCAGLTIAAWAFAGWPERTVATAMLIACVTTRIVRSPLADRYQDVEWGILAIDLCLTGVFLYVALRSDRWWPLAAVAILAPSWAAHLARVINPTFAANGYSIAGLSTYLLLPVAAWGIANQAISVRRAGSI